MTAAEFITEKTPLLEVRNLVQEFTVRGRGGVGKGGVVHAVSDVTFSVGARETLGIVGETGCGKSTLARSIIQSPRPRSGGVYLHGVDLTGLGSRELRSERRKIQMVFQDPFSSLDPKCTVTQSVEEPLLGQRVRPRASRRLRVAEILELVGLDPSRYGARHPRQLSGGEGQRIAIARALSTSPELIICDEPLSSLDVLIQAQVLRLFERLQSELGLSYLFISHDLAVVRHIANRVGVMYLGKICELGPTDELYAKPLHPYTAALLAANPSLDPQKRSTRPVLRVMGDPPSPLDPPSGCRFRTRCPLAEERCATDEPLLRQVTADHLVACHFPLGAE